VTRIRYFILFILITALAGCSLPPVSETALIDPDDESGMGGTGILAEESGMGGTGIIGEITGFGSIFVNGEEVEIAQNTALYFNGQPVVDYRFKRGEIVEILATEQQSMTVAREIHIRHEIIGPVEGINSQGDSFTVLGQEVLITSRNLSIPQIGRSVQISGFRDKQGRIHATRIEETKQPDVLLTGVLRKIKDSFYIGRQKLSYTDSAAFKEDTRVRVRGIIRAGVLNVSQYAPLDRLHFTAPVRRLLEQGFVDKRGDRQYNIGARVFAVRPLPLSRLFDTQADQIVRVEMSRNIAGGWEAIRSISPKGLPLGQPRLPDSRSYRKTERYNWPSRTGRINLPVRRN